jgi:hypothetical protein
MVYVPKQGYLKCGALVRQYCSTAADHRLCLSSAANESFLNAKQSGSLQVGKKKKRTGNGQFLSPPIKRTSFESIVAEIQIT